MKNHLETPAFAEHFRMNYPHSPPSITFIILVLQHDIVHLHVKEALTIQTENLKLNRRQEDLGAGCLP